MTVVATPVAKLAEEDSYTIIQNRLMERDLATTNRSYRQS